MQIIIDKKDRMKSGIYKITNAIDGKVYIGQTVCFVRRAQLHKSQLQRNKHGNHKLQNAVNKYGIDRFLFEIIAVCDIHDLDRQETEYLAQYIHNKKACYNHDLTPKRTSLEKVNLSDAIKRSWENSSERRKKTAENMIKTKINNPQMYENLKKTRRYIDPTGQIHVVNDLKTFCESHDLSYEVMRKMSKGSYISHKGWKSGDIQKEEKEDRESKTTVYRFMNPDGVIIETKNIAKLAEETKSDRTRFFRLINGRIKIYKGWTFVEKIALSE